MDGTGGADVLYLRPLSSSNNTRGHLVFSEEGLAPWMVRVAYRLGRRAVRGVGRLMAVMLGTVCT
jgi:hypothetical protein